MQEDIPYLPFGPAIGQALIDDIIANTGEHPNGLYLHFKTCLQARALQRIGATWAEYNSARTRAKRDYLRVSIKTPGLIKMLDEALIYTISAANAADVCYLSLVEDRIYVQYQQIIGTRFVGRMSAAQIGRLEAVLDQHFRSVLATGRTMGNAHDSGEHAAATSELSMPGELALCRISGQRLLLPTQTLRHYGAIKALLTKAGGVYKGGKAPAFVFPEGTDVSAVIDALGRGETINIRKQQQMFFTPSLEAGRIAELGLVGEGMRVLEPSAGGGALARAARERGAGEVVCIENHRPNVLALREQGFETLEEDFLGVAVERLGLFDVVLANPPFSRNQDIEHVEHMLAFLKPGGRLVTLMSTGWMTGHTARHLAFRERLEAMGARIETLPAGLFKAAGTGVAVARIVLTTTAEGVAQSDTQSSQNRELAAA